MGIYNRDYMKDSSGTGRGPGWTIVGWLIALNVAVYVIQHLLLDQTSPGGGFSLGDLFNGRFYTLVTSLFVHAGIMHIVFNMAMLFFAGKELLARVGLRHFLWVYFLGGISGTVLEAAVTALQGYNVNQIGASGAIMALICALATLIPWHRFSFLFFFVIPVTLTMRTFVMVLIGLDLVLGLIGVFSASTESLLGGKVAHFAHLGGAFWGLFYGWVILGRLNRGQKRKNAGLKLVPRTEGEPSQDLGRWEGMLQAVPDSDNAKKEIGKERRSHGTGHSMDSAVDAILDKMLAEGPKSLTDDERKVLEEESRRLAERRHGK